jgi:hypothetical protein
MASETLDVFAVLANRLGAWSVKAELEDLAFKTLQPEDYEQVRGRCHTRCPGSQPAQQSRPLGQPAGPTQQAGCGCAPGPARGNV